MREAFRVLTPGAAAAFTLWDSPDENTQEILDTAFAEGFTED